MNSANKIHVVWEYTVKKEYIEKFIEIYRPDGVWADLFRKYSGYKKTKLLRECSNEQKFITIDHWDSESAYNKMKEQSSTEYGMLDREFESYTISEKHIGTFESID